MTRLASIALVTGLLFAGVTGTTAQQTPQADKALAAANHKATVAGDLRGAIDDYKRIVESAGANRALAAESLLRMAECHQKLGETEEAQAIYARIVREFGDQKEPVTAAAALVQAQSPSFETTTRRLWSGSDVDGSLDVSPDGRTLAYVKNGGRTVTMRDVLTGHETTFGPNAQPCGDTAENPRFSRDGRHIVFGCMDDEAHGYAYHLRVGRVADHSSRQIYSNEEFVFLQAFDWFPDGERIAVTVTRPDQTSQIGIVSTRDGSLRVLKSIDWDAPDHIAVSPDGLYLAFDLSVDDGRDERRLHIVAVDGRGETVPQVPAGYVSPRDWTPDGSRLLFTRDQNGTEVWALPFVQGTPGVPERVSGNLGPVRVRRFTASNGLYFVSGLAPATTAPDIQLAVLDPGKGHVSARRLVGAGVTPSWSPSGDRLAFLRNKGAGPRNRIVLTIRTVETGDTRELASTMTFMGSYRWAPDGESFVVWGALKGLYGIYRIDAATGDVSPMVVSQRGRNEVVGTAVLSADQAHLYFRRRTFRDEQIEATWIVEREVASGVERRLGDPVPRHAETEAMILAPDGTSLLLRRVLPRDVSFVKVDIGTGRQTELIRRSDLGSIALSPDGRWIATWGRDSGDILLIATRDGAAHTLLPAAAPTRAVVRMWSPDSRAVIAMTGVATSSGSLAETGRTIVRLPIDGGPAEPMATDLAVLPAAVTVQPGGRGVAFSTPQPAPDRGLWVLERFLPSTSAPTVRGRR